MGDSVIAKKFKSLIILIFFTALHLDNVFYKNKETDETFLIQYESIQFASESLNVELTVF